MQITENTSSTKSGALEIGRALFTNGDYKETISVVEQIILGDGVDVESRFAAYLLKASSQSELGCYLASLETLRDAGPFLDDATARQKASFFGQRAHVNIKLNRDNGPLVDYEAARHWAQEADDELIEARVRNNLARVYSKSDRFVDAIVEVDAAIRIVTRLNDQINLGRFYDQKAQILLDHDHYAESVACGKKALGFLGDHPAALEARLTLGRALIKLGATYLEQPDPLDTFCAKRDAAKSIQVKLSPDLASMALRRSNGHVVQAAKFLGIRHYALTKIAARHSIERQPKRTRRKTLIKK